VSRIVTTTYLEMTAPGQLRPARAAALTVTRAELPSPAFNRFLYATVGEPWSWTTRLAWDRAQWMAYLDRPQLETWVGYVRGTPAGYFELEQDHGQVQIVYFGLFPDLVGRGLGGALLTAALERAWQLPTSRVWVHTCDLDHPRALANYRARGLHAYRVERHELDE
jgi:GNAT superfamily N-acetyltransferase